MTDCMIPNGYKKTSLGVIPKEWDTIKLKECFSISAGGDVQKECFSEFYSPQYKYPIYSNSLFNHGLYGFTSRPRKKANSITITGRGSLGHAEYRKTDFDAIVRLLVLTPKIALYGQFITEYINFRKPFFVESTGVPQLTAPQIANIQILFPPLPEQQKIAEIISTWDKAIEKQSRLIEKLELRKKGLMQQLLTAKKRLPGYSDSWKRIKYYNILTETHRSLKWDENELYDLISVRRRSGGVFHRESLYGYEIKTKNLRPALEGDFLISKMQIVHGASGVVPKQLSGMKISGSYIALVAKDPQELNINYFNLWSQMPLFYRQTFISSNGVHIEKMTFDLETFMSLSMDLPPIEEQNKIVTIISSACKDIELAKQKLELFRQQKHGLMQQLLTGKKRVNINN